MKLVYITASMPYGPRETFLIPEARELQKRVDLIIVPRSPSGRVINKDALDLADSAVREPLLSIRILATAFAFSVKHPFLCLRALLPLAKSGSLGNFIRNLAVTPKAFWLAEYARANDIDHIHCHWALTTSTMALVASIASGVPWSMTCHRGDIAGNNLLAYKMKHASFTRFISADGQRMAHTLTNAQSVRECVIHMGVNIPANCSHDRPEIPQIICPANLLPVKGHRYLIEAASMLKSKGVKFSLLLAGSGPLKDDLRELVAQLDLNDVVLFLGQVSHDELLSLYEKGEVFAIVLPSVDLGDNIREGIPVSLIEALAYGIPAISTETGGIPELLSGIGLLVKDKDSHALALAIEQVIKDHSLRDSMVAAGLNKVRLDFNVEETTSQLLRKIEGCLAV